MQLTEYSGLHDNETGEEVSKVIFLDIDGVMVIDYSAKNRDDDHVHLFDGEALRILNEIVRYTNCHIVISSSWRKRNLSWIRKVFQDRGFEKPERIIGETMRGYHFVEKGAHLPIPRGVEIKAWMDMFLRKIPTGWIDYKGKYAIIDDDSDMLLEQKDCFFKTGTTVGLTAPIGVKIIQHLNL